MTDPIRVTVISVKVDGKELAAKWSPYLTSLSISKEESGKSDSCEFEFDDSDGQLELPRESASVEVSLSWEERGQAVSFKGKTDEPTCSIARGGGMTLSLNATAADMKSKAKQKRHRHKDDATLKDAAAHFADGTGMSITVDETLGATKRDYWAMSGESFLAWGARTADELGAIFKVEGDRAVFASRGDGKSATGKTLPTLTVARGVNLISGKITPRQSRQRFKKTVVHWYDRKSASYKKEEVETGDDGVDAAAEATFKAADKDRAKSRAGGNKKGGKSDKGGGDVTIVGDPLAQPGAPCVISDWRDGIDGDYKIKSVKHAVSRGVGWQTTVTLEQPDGAAGKDSRKTKAKAS